MEKRVYRFLTSLVGFALLVSVAAAQTDSVALESPDGKLAIEFRTSGHGQLTYSVSRDGEPVLETSKLGLMLPGGAPLGSRVKIERTSRSSVEETYEVIHGKSNPVRNHYNALSIELAETDGRGRKMEIEARAYDEGVAFRYVVPAQAAIPDPVGFRLAGEITEFNFANDAVSFPLYLDGFTTSYENEYTREAISGIAADRLIGLPLLVEFPSVGYVAITEAQLAEYGGAYLRKGAGHGFRVDLASVGGPKVEHGLPHQSPWRVVMVAPDVGRLIESNIVINLNPAPQGDFSWVRPGKSLWDWWAGSYQTDRGWKTGMDTRTFKYMIDFAAERNFDYILIDDGWT